MQMARTGTNIVSTTAIICSILALNGVGLALLGLKRLVGVSDSPTGTSDLAGDLRLAIW
jgi:hypothetical protein